MELASMPIAGYVTIAGAAVVVLALVFYLMGVIAVLRKVDNQLGDITGAVLTIIAQTRPVELVVTAIANDLVVGRGVLVGLLEKKVGPAAARAAMANALGPAPAAANVAPEAAPGDYPSSAPGKISYSRTSEFPAADAPAAAAADPSKISYSRTTEFPSAAAPPAAPAAPAAPADPDEPARIVYRRTIG